MGKLVARTDHELFERVLWIEAVLDRLDVDEMAGGARADRCGSALRCEKEVAFAAVLFLFELKSVRRGVVYLPLDRMIVKANFDQYLGEQFRVVKTNPILGDLAGRQFDDSGLGVYV